MMMSKSEAWREARKEGKYITLTLYACNVASEEFRDLGGNFYKPQYGGTFAQRLSLYLKDKVKVVVPDGYVAYKKDSHGKYLIGTTRNHLGDGGMITFVNGKQISKQVQQQGVSDPLHYKTGH